MAKYKYVAEEIHKVIKKSKAEWTNDEIDQEIRKYSMKKWGNSYQPYLKNLYEGKDYEGLRRVIRNEVKVYLLHNDDFTVKQAVEAFRRSRAYVSQEDFYSDSIKQELKNLGVYRNMVNTETYDKTRKKGTFNKISDVKYKGYATIDGISYRKYAFKSNGRQFYVYTNLSPKSENYKPLITKENYGE